MRTSTVIELGTTDVLAVAHDVAGWVLIVFAVLIVAVAGPRRRSRIFAVLFAAVIVIVVVSGWSAPAAAASPHAPPSGADSLGWLGAAALGAGAVGLGFGVLLVKAALHMLGQAIAALFYGLRIAAFAAGLLGLVFLVLSV